VPRGLSRASRAYVAAACWAYAALALTAAVATAAPGDLDTSFGPGGKVLTGFEGTAACSAAACNAYGYALLSQPDGRLVALGSAGYPRFGVFGPDRDFALARYEPDGTLDPSFGTQGRQTAAFGPGTGAEDDSVAEDGVLQPDGKIVAAGTKGYFTGDFALARFNADGSLDNSFGSEGRVLLDVGGNDRIFGVALQADDKIVAAGMSGDAVAFARYDPDGRLDPSFSGDGTLTLALGKGSRVFGVAIQPDGRIIAAGVSERRFLLVRLQPDGTLDASFSGDGVVTTKLGRSASAADLALQPDGKIVAAGLAGTARRFEFALARYQSDGRLDRSFSQDGKVATGIGGRRASASAVALQPDGKIVAAGASARGKSAKRDFALARYTPAGRLDRSFSGKGFLLTDVGGNWDIAADLAVGPTGTIVAVGTAEQRNFRGDSVFANFALARYQG
jgi:uncharacterized delta-60 repeat protein